MYLFIAPDGSVRATNDRKELKTPFKWAGYSGTAVEISASPVDLSEFKPKTPAPTAGVSQNEQVAQLLAANAAQAAKIDQLLALVEKAAAKPAEPPK